MGRHSKISLLALSFIVALVIIAGCAISPATQRPPAPPTTLLPTENNASTPALMSTPTPTPSPSLNPTPTPTVPTTPTPTPAIKIPELDVVKTSVVLQERNDLPKIRLQTKKPKELDDNRIGDMWHLQDRTSCPTFDTRNWAYNDWTFNHVNKLGLKWVRLSIDRFDWNQVEPNNAYSKFKINTCQDTIITLLAENNVKIMYTITYWDETIHVAKGYPRYQKEDEIQRYLDYTRFIVRNFKDRIDYYEILNEPVLMAPQQHVEFNDYINLIRRVVPVIREEHPGAKIVAGGAARLSDLYSQGYLFGLLRSDVMPLIDAISIHPMYGTSPQYNDIKQYYYDYPSLIQKIKDEASTHGFKGEYIAEEMCWRTSMNPNPYEPWQYTEIVAAKYYARGIVVNLGLDVWAGIGGEHFDQIPPVVQVVQNLCTVMAGAKTTTLPTSVKSEATNIKSYAFSLSNSDRLIALWTDGIAVDDDLGVEATLTIPNLSTPKVVGIDVLNGFEQELRSIMENGNLVIANLLIKDYPTIICLTGNTPS